MIARRSSSSRSGGSRSRPTLVHASLGVEPGQILANSATAILRLAVAGLASVGLLGLSAAPAAAAPTPIAWHTGVELAKELAQPVGVRWSGTPLRETLTGLSRARRVAVLIDRRVDPGQELELTANDVPLEQVFRAVAERRRLGLSLVGPVVYLGPPRVAARLRTLNELRREDARGLTPSGRQKFLQSRRIRWDDFATPRTLLGDLDAGNGFAISGLDQVPHDLWAAADLPPLPLVDRLGLIAVQFDLTFHIAADAKTVTLVPVPDEVAIDRSYPGGRQPEQVASRWAALAPDARIRVVGDRIHVRGLLEDHERMTAPGRTPGRPPTGPGRPGEGETRFTVREAKGPLGEVLRQLAERLQVELKIDHEGLERAGISLNQPVAFSVEEATLDELFEAVLAPAGCRFRRKGSLLEIGPAE